MVVDTYDKETFAFYYPDLVDEVEEWVDVGTLEKKLIFRDGRVMYYNVCNNRLYKKESLSPNLPEEEYRKIFANRLRNRMEAKAMNEKFLSEKSGVSQSSVNGYLQGKRLPTIQTAFKLAEALSCDLSALLNE